MPKRTLAKAAAALFVLGAACALGLEGLLHGERSAALDSPGATMGSWLSSVIDGPDDAPESRVHLRVPDPGQLLVTATRYAPRAVPRGELRAHAYQFVSRVFVRPAARPRARGFVRRGVVLHARERVRGPGCRGTWYTLRGGGVVCSSDGFAVSREPRPALAAQRAPDVTRALPFRYAKVTAKDALRFFRIPTEAEEAEIARALAEDQRLPDVVERRMNGVYLLALDREERAGDRVFWRTVRGRYVRGRDIEIKREPRMRGELLGPDVTLPFAFVYGEEQEHTPVYALSADGKTLERIGVAENHARVRVLREVTVRDQALVVGPNDLALARERLRVARRTERPEGVPDHAKWIHVDLAEQVLVAYEGQRPVFATLVSSGKGEEFATPTGLYRIGEKHISTTMSGPDPDHGVYEVEEVPWTMYYDESYALHGAYWHDSFGQTRSHGCTNISPIDARWLFYWSDGELPPGWHALRNFEGTYVYLTDAEREERVNRAGDRREAG